MRSPKETAQYSKRMFGYLPSGFGYAPGRVNIIGTHTDYNCGRVISAAIPFGTTVAVSWNDSKVVRLASDQQVGVVNLSVGELPKDSAISWARYVIGTLSELKLASQGLDLAIACDLPMRRGLASSAALTVATAAACMRTKMNLSLKELALRCQQVEHRYLGVHCGILDQMTALNSVGGKLLLTDCLSMECTYLDCPGNLAIVICDSGTSRSLTHSQYNIRREECQEAARMLSYRSLRDAHSGDLGALRRVHPVLAKRVEHVVNENQRVACLATALSDRDMQSVRKILSGAHASCRDLYECSLPEIDRLSNVATSAPRNSSIIVALSSPALYTSWIGSDGQ